jgi:long-chain fatty acid transport protein
MEAMLKGSSIVYGVQAGATYRINDMIGVFGGVRMLFASNSYEGYLRNIKINPQRAGLEAFLDGNMIGSDDLNIKGDAINNYANTLPPEAAETAALLRAVAGGLKNVASQTGDKSLDVRQKGNGIAPILGIHFNVGNLSLAAKYEFNAKITIKNDTKEDVQPAMYPDGQKLRSDVPAVLSLAGSYDILPALKFSVTYLHHFEPQATIESWDAVNRKIVRRQDLIEKGANEYMAGLEWKLSNRLTISTGCQWSDVTVSDLWQNDISHNLDNFTVGIGAAYHFNDRLTLNIGGLNTWYSPVSVKTDAYTQKYDRTNKALAIGIDYRF